MQNANLVSEDEKSPYTTIEEIGRDPSWPFSASSMRYLVFNAEHNGLSKSIRKVGKKILIHKKSFISWIENETYKIK